MLSSGQELKCWSQSRSWDAVVRTGIKMTEVKAGVELLSSGQEWKCSIQSRSWDADVRTGIKMLKSKQVLKISNLFLRGSVGLEGKINDERMISQTPIVHKLGVLSSWCLADCSKSVREKPVKKSQWRRVNVLSNVDWSFVLLGSEERECALSCWLACPAAGLWGNDKRAREMVSAAFYVARGRWPGQNGISHSHWT